MYTFLQLLAALFGGLLIGYVLGYAFNKLDRKVLINYYTRHLASKDQTIAALTVINMQQKETLKELQDLSLNDALTIQNQLDYIDSIRELLAGLLNREAEKETPDE